MLGWFLRSMEAHLLRYGSTGRENATRSPVPRSIRCRRAGTRTCPPTAPSGAAPAGRGRDRKGHTVLQSPLSCAHFVRRRARSGVLDAGQNAENKWKSMSINGNSHTNKTYGVLVIPQWTPLCRTHMRGSILSLVTGRKSHKHNSTASALNLTDYNVEGRITQSINEPQVPVSLRGIPGILTINMTFVQTRSPISQCLRRQAVFFKLIYMKSTTPGNIAVELMTVPMTNKHPDMIAWPGSVIETMCNFSSHVKQ